MRRNRINKINRINERSFADSPIRPISRDTGSSLSVCKIYSSWYKNKTEGVGSGFFIKIKKDENNDLYQYFLVTCEHVVPKTEFEKGYQDICISYHLERVQLAIRLDKNERFIKEYETSDNVDITIIELKENEVPIQYFLEPDYNVTKNYHQYLGKKIIIHQFPKCFEQCYSEGEIIDINYISKEMYYKVSTECGSSGSPIVIKKNGYVIGVHKQGTFNKNVANFFDVVLTDGERKNGVFYKRENNNIIRNINYTRQSSLVERTINKRIYEKDNFKIILEKKIYNSYYLTVINNDTHSEYNTHIEEERDEDIFDLFDAKSHNFKLFEENEDILKLKVDNNTVYTLERKRTESMMYKSLKHSTPYPHIQVMHKEMKMESMRPIKREYNIINEFNNLSLNSYKFNNKKEDDENVNNFESKNDNYTKKDDTCNIW